MTKEIQLKVKDTYRVSKTEKATKKGMDDGTSSNAKKTVCQFGEEDGSALVVNLLQKVKMKDKGACIYGGNGTEDKGTLRFEQLIIKNAPHVPMAFMTLG